MYGKKLAEIRKSRGLKREDLAEKLKTSYETIRRWEKEIINIPSSKINEICEILNIPPSYLMGEETVTIKYPLGYLTNPEKIDIKDFMPAGASYILAKVKDEQMKFANMDSGDLVIIDTNNKKSDDNSIYAVSLGNGLFFSKLKEFKNEIIVILCNCHQLEIQIYHKSEIEIVGKVVRIIKQL